MTPPHKIKELREICEKATPGPWVQEHFYVSARIAGGRPNGEIIVCVQGTALKDNRYPFNQQCNNAEFIAQARSALPELLDYVEELEKANESLNRLLDSAEEKANWNRND